MPFHEKTKFETLSGTQNPHWGQACLLLLVGLFSFTYNLNISLFEGTEGLYGQIIREMVQSGEYRQLTFQGQPYISKPPLFFWLTGGLTQLFGDNEIALRLPGTLFSLGTMVLTFVLGRILFSWQVGFWAAFVFATNHVFLWYGRRVLTDSPLTFFMTLAILGWVLGNRKGASSAWHVLTFLSMALGTMVKGLHGFALPFLLIVAYSIWLKDFQAFKRWGFWVGGLLFIIIMKGYSSMLGTSSQWHFAWSALLVDSFDWDLFGGTGRRPKIPSFLFLIWFDFFPWSVLIPSTVIVLFRMRPFKNNPGVLLILLWFLGYLLVLCLSIWRREPYLMPLVPGFALTIGYCLVSLTTGVVHPRWHRLLIGASFGILTITILVGAMFGPSLLHKKWHVSPDFLPIWYSILFTAIGGILVWAALRGRFQIMQKGLIALGLCFAFGVINLFLPAVDAADAPRRIIFQSRELASSPGARLYHYGLTQEDLIYYVNADPRIPRLYTTQQVVEQANKGNILLVTDWQDADLLRNNPLLEVQNIQEYRMPRGTTYNLLSIEVKTSKSLEARIQW